MPETIGKVSIIISKGSLEGVYPGLILANSARMEGIAANVFFMFFGLEAINRQHFQHLKVATVGNPGLHVPTMIGGLPGVASVITRQMEQKIAQLDMPPVPEFIALLVDSGAKLYACQASAEMFDLTRDDLIDEIEGIVTVGEFYGIAAGGQIIFT
jgi:peroxiredoxin family protein